MTHGSCCTGHLLEVASHDADVTLFSQLGAIAPIERNAQQKTGETAPRFAVARRLRVFEIDLLKIMSQTTTYRDYPTQLERYALNPHNLESGDRCILPDGKIAEIDRAGFKWAKFFDRSPQLLKNLRPFNESEAGKPVEDQLSLL